MNVPDAVEMARLARAHWQEHRPRWYAHLAQSGQLETMLETAVSQTREAMAVLANQGTTPLEAGQLLREEWRLVAAEENDGSTLAAPS